jgi:proline dehydrogenase
MFTVVKQKVNSSGIRTRLGMAPDLIQARIMNGNLVVEIVEGSVEQETLVDKIINEKIKELS